MPNITTCAPGEHPCTGCGLPTEVNLELCNLCEDRRAAAGGRERDNCQICHGERGGVKGNENVIAGVVVCDYCTADCLSR